MAAWLLSLFGRFDALLGRTGLVRRFACVAVVIVVAAGVQVGRAGAVTGYSVVDVATLTNGGGTPEPKVNLLNHVAGNGYFWDGSSLQSISGFDLNDGDVVVGSHVFKRNGPTHAATWTPSGGWQDLGALGIGLSYGLGINNKGTVVGEFNVSSTLLHAFMYENGVMTDLGSLSSQSSSANDVNLADHVVGYYNTGDACNYGAFLDEAGLMIPLSGCWGRAEAINDHDQIVGTSAACGSGCPIHATSWQNGVRVDLGNLGGANQLQSVAYDINNSGDIVGECNQNTFGIGCLFSGGSVYDLNSLIPSGSGFTISSGDGINDNGDIVATATDASGALHLVLLRPNPSFVPPEQTFGVGDGDVAANPTADVGGDLSSDSYGSVDTATGSYFVSSGDLRLPGIGVPFEFTRGYNSGDPISGEFGPGWAYTYGASLTVQSGAATFRGGDGQELSFTQNVDGSYKPGTGGRATLTASGGGYELVTQSQLHYGFDSVGRLTFVHDRNGEGVSVGYANGVLASVTDSAGRVVVVTHNGAGLIDSVSLPDGRSVHYGYTNGMLTSVTDARGGLTQYGYDPVTGKLATITDPNGHTPVQNSYDASSGRLTGQIDARGNPSSFSWNPATQTSTFTDARGHAWQDVYLNNALVKSIDPYGHMAQYSYDSNMDVVSVTDPRGNTTSMQYDQRGNMTSRVAPSPVSYTEGWSYDSFNDVTSYTDGRGDTTTYGYDGEGNLTSKTEPGSVLTQFGRDPATGLLTSLTDPNGRTTSYGYDSGGNLVSVVSPLGEKATMGYDSSGRMISRVDPRGNIAGADPSQYTTTYGYDNGDHRISETDPLGDATTWAYDPAGNLTAVTDPNNHTTGYGFDAANELATVTAPDQTQTTYTYDPAGNLATRVDANQHTTSYGYDNANRLTTMQLPAGQHWAYSYDAGGNRTQTQDANNATSTYTYDALNRVTNISYSGTSTPAVSYSYDANSNRTQMTDGSGTVTYVYDALNRLTSLARGSDTFSYAYDPASNVTSRTYPGSLVASYGYDNDERLASASQSSQTTSYGYDAAGNLTTTTLPSGNGYVETRTYDRAGRLIEVKAQKGSGVLADYTGTLDPVGNPLTISQTGATTETSTYSYDNRDRLTGVCYQSGSCPGANDPYIRWAYDPVGNRLTETRPSATTSYTYDSDDRLTAAGSTAYGYDANGNQTSAGSSTFSYDVANRLKTAAISGTTTTYSYDGDGNRLQASTGSQNSKKTNYLWDTNLPLAQLALERDGGGALLRNYLYGADLISMTTPAGTFYYHYDLLGSVVNITSSTGTTQWTYSYEPYGNPRTTQNATGAPTNTMRFTGEYLDPTGLYNLRARQYDPTDGRFLESDPSSQSSLLPDIGAYVYVDDDPTLGIDPSGQFCWGCVLPSIGSGLAVDVHLIGRGGAVVARGSVTAADAATLLLTLPFILGGDDSAAQRIALHAKAHSPNYERDEHGNIIAGTGPGKGPSLSDAEAQALRDAAAGRPVDQSTLTSARKKLAAQQKYAGMRNKQKRQR